MNNINRYFDAVFNTPYNSNLYNEGIFNAISKLEDAVSDEKNPAPHPLKSRQGQIVSRKKLLNPENSGECVNVDFYIKAHFHVTRTSYIIRAVRWDDPNKKMKYRSKSSFDEAMGAVVNAIFNLNPNAPKAKVKDRKDLPLDDNNNNNLTSQLSQTSPNDKNINDE